MTPDQKMDRVERLARLLCEKPLYPEHTSGIQTATLCDYAVALGKYDEARQVLAAEPDRPEANEAARIAAETLDRARQEVKRQFKTRPRRFPG